MKKFRHIFEFKHFTETGLERKRVRLRKIVRFGYINQEEFTKAGTFKCFRKVGYVQTTTQTYLMSKYIMADFLRMYKGWWTHSGSQDVQAVRNEKIVVAKNWHYVFKELPAEAFSDKISDE